MKVGEEKCRLKDFETAICEDKVYKLFGAKDSLTIAKDSKAQVLINDVGALTSRLELN